MKCTGTLQQGWHCASNAHLLIGYLSLDQLNGQSLPSLPPGLGEKLSDCVPHGIHTHLADLGTDFCLRVTQGHTLSTNIRTHKLKSSKFSHTISHRNFVCCKPLNTYFNNNNNSQDLKRIMISRKFVAENYFIIVN